MKNKELNQNIATKTTVPMLTVNDRAVKLPEVMALTSKSKTVIYADMRAGRFPKSFKIGLKASAWSLNEINAWLESRKQTGE